MSGMGVGDNLGTLKSNKSQVLGAMVRVVWCGVVWRGVA